jgi:hypothetical protein
MTSGLGSRFGPSQVVEMTESRFSRGATGCDTPCHSELGTIGVSELPSNECVFVSMILGPEWCGAASCELA